MKPLQISICGIGGSKSFYIDTCCVFVVIFITRYKIRGLSQALYITIHSPDVVQVETICDFISNYCLI